MTIPFEPLIFGIKVNIHLILEYLSFFIAFRYYSYLRNAQKDHITSTNRLSIILGAIIGAFLGSRIMGYLENPVLHFNQDTVMELINTKTIMGGLFGGLLGVETSKKIIDEKKSSGDLFTLPIIVGIFIGRIGCFLSGTKEFTYGTSTNFFLGMNLGDGQLRHPTALYEIIFLALLFLLLKRMRDRMKPEEGLIFKLFMIFYFSFRFGIEFIKPNIFFIFGLSSIQWLCVICWIYYYNTIKTFIKYIKYAYQKVYLL